MAAFKPLVKAATRCRRRSRLLLRRLQFASEPACNLGRRERINGIALQAHQAAWPLAVWSRHQHQPLATACTIQGFRCPAHRPIMTGGTGESSARLRSRRWARTRIRDGEARLGTGPPLHATRRSGIVSFRGQGQSHRPRDAGSLARINTSVCRCNCGRDGPLEARRAEDGHGYI